MHQMTLVVMDGIAAYGVDFWMLCDEFGDGGDESWHHLVVAVENADVPSERYRRGGHDATPISSVLLAEQTDSRLVSIGIHDMCNGIGKAVIDNHQFPIRGCLCEN
jgi:hypothetical protein